MLFSTSPTTDQVQSSILFRLIQVYPHEFSRVFISWIFRFVYRFALVIAWTFIVAYFVRQFGHDTLSYLFLLHALTVIVGSILFIRLSHLFSLESLFLGFILFALSFLLVAQFLVGRGDFFMLVALFFVEGFVFIQLSINFDTFVERLFTPLESVRTFPVIESADTLGGLLGGVFLFFLSSYLNLFSLLWIFIGSLSLLIPPLLLYHRFIRLAPGMCMFRKQLLGHLSADRSLHKAYKSVKKHRFIRILAFSVFLQWMISVLLEFLFTVSVSKEALHSLPATTSGAENILIHEFGFLSIFLSLVAFISQIFIAPRAIRLLGIIPSMLLHPLMYILSLFGLVGSFGFFSTVLARLNGEITGGIYRNAYQSAYYVFEEEESQHTRLFLEGLVRPLSVFVGSLYLLLIRLFVPDASFLPLVLLGMFAAVFTFLFVVSGLQKSYLETTTSQLFSPHVSENLKLHLLEILGEHGNEEGYPVFYKLLQDKNLSLTLRLKILDLLKSDRQIIPFLIDFGTDDNHELRFFSFRILRSFAEKDHFSDERFFSRQALFQLLKTQYVAETHDEIRLVILETLAFTGGKEAHEFFMNAFQVSTAHELSLLLFASRFLRDEGIYPFLEPYLDSRDGRAWSAASITLSRSPRFRQRILDLVGDRLQDLQSPFFLEALGVVRFLHEESFLELLVSQLSKTTHLESQFFIVMTLAQLGHQPSILRCIDFFLDEKMAVKAHEMLQNFPSSIRCFVEEKVHHIVYHRLHQLLKYHHASLENLSLVDLRQLRILYLLLNASEDVLIIDSLLHAKDSSYHPPLLLHLSLRIL